MADVWQSLAEMDAQFARSRARVLDRRRAPAEAEMRGRLRALGFLLGITVLAAAVAVAVGQTRTSAPAAAPSPATAKAVRVEYKLPAACRVPRRFQQAFVAASRDTGLPLSLLVAVAYEESRMNPSARSHVGARGLLQIMPATAQALSLDAARPKTNILAGARYLRSMLTRFGDLSLALSAYNAGPAAVERAGGAPSVAVLRYAANIEARAASLAVCDAG